MSLQLTIKQFEEVNLFSNKNIEKVISSVVNGSSNAALVSMFEDSIILLDHEDGQFYTADYAFDGKKLNLVMENFQPIELTKENTSFKNNIANFFESEDSSVSDLTSSYKESVLDQEKFINELISESLSTKNFEGMVNYKELAESNNDISIADKPYFIDYKNRLETNPLNEVKYFNWKDKVVVSLLESEKIKLINSTVSEKANDLWKKAEFKEMFGEAASVFIEDVEKGKEKFVALFEQYPQIFVLDNADKKTMFGKGIISNPELREHLEDLQKGMSVLFEDEDVKEISSSYLSLMEEEGEEDSEAEEPSEEKPEEKEEPAKELTPEEIQDIAGELKTLSKKIEDEGLKGELDSLIAKLDSSVEEGTRPDLIKKAIYLLTI
jgi:hypothetical protein